MTLFWINSKFKISGKKKIIISTKKIEKKIEIDEIYIK